MSCCGYSGFYQSFSTFNMSDHTLSTWLVFDDTVGSKKNLEEKTREVTDISMYQFSWNFLQLECYMLWWLWLARFFFILSRSLKVHESWCSTTSWTGRRTWRRRQRSSLTLQCITSVENFFNQNLIWLVYLG